jgi:hypothetical protein
MHRDLDHHRPHLHRIGSLAMSLSRPPESTQADIDELAKAFDRRYARMNINHGFNGSTKFVNAMLIIITGLITAGILSDIGMSNRMSALEAKVDLLMQGKIK